ncbi:hypothetical protein DFH08DRAFT_636961, partial [Mycena albidolilacea]
LTNIFGGTISRPFGKLAHHSQVVSEEGLYMELLTAEYSDKEPDMAVLESSDDNFEE